MTLHVGDEALEVGGEALEVGAVPRGEDLGEGLPTRHLELPKGALPVAREDDGARSPVDGVDSPADEPSVDEPADVAARRRRIHSEPLGDLRQPGGTALGDPAEDGVGDGLEGDPRPLLDPGRDGEETGTPDEDGERPFDPGEGDIPGGRWRG